MSILGVMSGPVIGSIIGYGTNYIAVKMLFRPLKPVKIGNYTLPLPRASSRKENAAR